MKRPIQTIVSFALFVLTCITCDAHIIDDTIIGVMQKYDAIGVSVAIVKNNSIVYMNSFGSNPVYDLEEKDYPPLRTDGFFWLASVSKTFISTSIMQLVEKKKIKLEDDVNKYLDFSVRNPCYPDNPITVRMLLCHRSGLNDSQYGWTLKMLEKKDSPAYSASFNSYEPGHKYDYCNLGYSLLGAIIENVSGMRFDEYVDKFILRKLQLSGSFNLTNIDCSKLIYAMQYDQDLEIFRKEPSIYNYDVIRKTLVSYELGHSTAGLSPAGGMRITIESLAKYAIAHMNYGRFHFKRILKKQSELEMWKPQGDGTNYGFAFSTYTTIVPGVNLIGMTGGSHGFHTAMFFDPQKRTGFVVMCNGCNSKWGNGGDMNYAIVKELYDFLHNKH